MNKFFIAFLFLLAFLETSVFAYGKRIVTLAPNITKAIQQLDAQTQIVGCTSYCNLKESASVKVVATAIQVYVEKIVSLKPDIIITAELTNIETINTLRKLGYEVIVFPSANSFNDLCEQFIQIGIIVGKKEKAEQIIKQSKNQLKMLTERFGEKKKSKIFFQIGAEPIFTVLPNTFMNDYITLANGENIANNMKFGTLTREFVLASNPDIIIITSMGITGNEEKVIWEKYKTINAIKNKKILIVDADKACSPTPVDFVDTFEQIANFLIDTY